MYIQLLLDDHDMETDIWPWGGEPIYRNGKQVGLCTTTGYGFTFKKQVLQFDKKRSENNIYYTDFIGLPRICREHRRKRCET